MQKNNEIVIFETEDHQNMTRPKGNEATYILKKEINGESICSRDCCEACWIEKHPK